MPKEKQTRPTRGQPPKLDKKKKVYFSAKESQIRALGGENKAKKLLSQMWELLLTANQAKIYDKSET